MLTIRKLLARDQEPLSETFPQHPAGRFEDYYIEHLRELRFVLVAFEQVEDEILDYWAYASILWEAPSTTLWQRQIPEIVDIFVHPEARRQGIATALIKACENAARDKKLRKIGLSVGRGEDFAPAQQLYEKLGYQLLAQNPKELILVKEIT